MGHHLRADRNGQADGGSTLGAGGWNTINFQSPAFGEPVPFFATGWCTTETTCSASATIAGIRPSPGQIDYPSQWIHPDAGKMPKMNQWSISLQREITRDLMVEVAYVGNRGAGFMANNLMALNAISEERLRSFGLDINNANDQALLRARLDSPMAASRGFNRLPYAGYSGRTRSRRAFGRSRSSATIDRSACPSASPGTTRCS